MDSAHGFVTHAEAGQAEGERLPVVTSILPQIAQVDPGLAQKELVCEPAVHKFAPNEQQKRALTGQSLRVVRCYQCWHLFRCPRQLMRFLLNHLLAADLFFRRVYDWARFRVKRCIVERKAEYEVVLGHLRIDPLGQGHDVV